MPIDTGSPLSAHYQLLPSKDGLYTIRDRIDGQVIATRNAALAYASNGQAILRLTGSSDVLFSLKEANNSTLKWGFAYWVFPTTAPNGYMGTCLSTLGANDSKFYIDRDSNGKLNFVVYSFDAFHGYMYAAPNGSLKLNQWNFIRYAFDGLQATNDDKISIFVDEVKRVGVVTGIAGSDGTLTQMRKPTGLFTLGELSVGSGSGIVGFVGSQFFFFDDNVTAAQGAFYMQMQRPAA